PSARWGSPSTRWHLPFATCHSPSAIRHLPSAIWTKRLRRGMGGAGWVVAQDGRDLTVERVGCDTLGFPAVVAGDLWPPRTKGYHDVRTEKPSDPGHAARRAG